MRFIHIFLMILSICYSSAPCFASQIEPQVSGHILQEDFIDNGNWYGGRVENGTLFLSVFQTMSSQESNTASLEEILQSHNDFIIEFNISYQFASACAECEFGFYLNNNSYYINIGSKGNYSIVYDYPDVTAYKEDSLLNVNHYSYYTNESDGDIYFKVVAGGADNWHTADLEVAWINIYEPVSDEEPPTRNTVDRLIIVIFFCLIVGLIVAAIVFVIKRKSRKADI